jgi:hypothetical protein
MLFVLRERRAPEPVLDLSLFRSGPFAVAAPASLTLNCSAISRRVINLVSRTFGPHDCTRGITMRAAHKSWKTYALGAAALTALLSATA